LQLERAVEVFVTAFAASRSRTYPYVATYHEGLWVMQDTPSRKNSRKTEVIAWEREPESVVQTIQKMELGWHFVCHQHIDDAEFMQVRSAYKALGYRAMFTEWIFVHDGQTFPKFDCHPCVQQVVSQEMLTTIPQVAKQPRKLSDPHRLFGIWDETRDYGWVESIPVGDDAYVASLHVHKEFRGRGYGRALMGKLLQVDRENGVNRSVLVASSDGARLYPHLGYQKIATMQIFCPVKRSTR
jgi:GNAT superfamily N-acetyltransferase